MPQQSEIEVHIVKFRENGTGTCLVELVPGPLFTGPLKSDGELSVPTNYKIRMERRNDRHPVRFTVKAAPGSTEDSEEYRLVGIYFVNGDIFREDPTNPQKPVVSKGRRIGQDQFPKFECEIGGSTPGLTVHIDRNAAQASDEFEFVLVVQRLRDGALGLIDPEWENN